MDLNKAMIIGRLTRDPEARTTPQGTTVTSFSVATNFVWKDQTGTRHDKTEFHNIVAWRKLAETIVQYLRKGSRLYIEGRLQTREWQTQDGQRRTRTEIIADRMIMLDSRPAGGPTALSVPAATTPVPPPAPPTTEPPAPAPTAETSSGEEIKVEDIPF